MQPKTFLEPFYVIYTPDSEADGDKSSLEGPIYERQDAENKGKAIQRRIKAGALPTGEVKVFDANYATVWPLDVSAGG